MQGVQVGVAQIFAAGNDPVVVVAGQQISFVEGDGRFQTAHFFLICNGRFRRGQRRFKFGHVQNEIGIAAPLQSHGICRQVAICIGEGLAQGVEQVAQIGPRLAVG